MKKINKKLLMIISSFILIPNIVWAECDPTKIIEYESMANNVTSNRTYVSKTGTFKVTLYNVVNGIYVKYNNEKYERNSNNEVIIKDIPEGTDMEILIFPNSSTCNDIASSINVSIPYYNKFYHDERCGEYMETLSVCSQKFLTIPMNEPLFKETLENQKKPLIETEPPHVMSFSEKFWKFMLDWGIKGLIVIGVSVGSYIFFSKKYRKIKHGI